jgi:hypothetical protein
MVRLRSDATVKLLVTAAIAVGAGAAAVAAAGAHTAGGSASSASWTSWHFVSAPGLMPPKVRAMHRSAADQLARGYFLLTTGGPLILDRALQPVWFESPPSIGLALDLKQQRFEGKPVLSWWQGTQGSTGSGAGKLYVVDEHYRLVATLTGRGGWQIDSHDAVISGHNVWVTAERFLQPENFSRYGGTARGTLWDAAVQEYDLRNGRLLRTWDALRHVPLSESETGAPQQQAGTWDAFHLNSIQLIGSHSFLVSMRNTSAIYMVDARTGRIRWTLGGKRSTFRLPGRARFSFQHDARLHRGAVVTLFDDRCCDLEGSRPSSTPAGPSRGLVLKLGFKAHRASLIRQYLHHPPLYAAWEGSMRQLASGNVLIGWGTSPYFSEYSSRGRLLLDAEDRGGESYRVLFTSSWVGTPFYPPTAAVHNRNGRSTLYASWNGATEVAIWEVLAGPGPAHLRVVARQPRQGFETAIGVPARAFSVLRLQALNASGRVIGARSLSGT